MKVHIKLRNLYLPQRKKLPTDKEGLGENLILKKSFKPYREASLD